MPPGTRSDDFPTVFNQPIELPGIGGWEIALLQAKLWYSWYNISAAKSNNLLRYSPDGGGTWENVVIPDGQYEISQINDVLHSVMKANGDSFLDPNGDDAFNINILPNYSTLKVEVEIVPLSTYQLDVGASLIYLLLGFTAIIVTASQSGVNVANINDDINSLSIESDVVMGAYSNGRSGNVLWSFVPTTSPGTNINIDIINPVYVGVSNRRIQRINMRIVDNLGRRVDLNGQPVTYLLAIRRNTDNSLTNEILQKILEK